MTGVAIVIPMLNEAAGLPRLLRSLAALEPPPAEVLAVDGGSTDASVAIAEAAGLLVVRHETRGRAAAINRGVQESHGTDHLRAARRHLAARRRGCRDAQGARGSWDRPGRLHPPSQRAGSGPLGDQLP
jgi:glycosyltransferase involved in cell wall biosynthesis